MSDSESDSEYRTDWEDSRDRMSLKLMSTDSTVVALRPSEEAFERWSRIPVETRRDAGQRLKICAFWLPILLQREPTSIAQWAEQIGVIDANDSDELTLKHLRKIETLEAIFRALERGTLKKDQSKHVVWISNMFNLRSAEVLDDALHWLERTGEPAIRRRILDLGHANIRFTTLHVIFTEFAKFIQEMGTNLERTMKSLTARPSDYQVEKCEEMKKKGNDNFQKKQYEEALKFYSKAVKFYPDNHIIYGNRALCYIRCNRYLKAVGDGKRATLIKPLWAKGHYRYCEALFSLGEYKMAIEANKLARLLCKADPEGTKDLEQQHQKFIAEMPEPKVVHPKKTHSKRPDSINRAHAAVNKTDPPPQNKVSEVKVEKQPVKNVQSDAFVQQEMALKMSMCQFSVPLLLPDCDTKQCTLMLWAMRDIVKKYRPQSLSESKGFIEQRIVLSELPMISFVRLGECSLSKSEILNKLLSNSQQYHDTFVHHDMECGDSPRRISNGLVEMTWYLPCGNKNMDIFSEPVAVANLRGDIASFETQFSFLCQTSAAVFVFFDNLDSECELLTNQHHKAQIFLVGNHQSKHFSFDAVKKVATKLGLTKSNILIKAKQINDADFVKKLQRTVNNVVENSKKKMQIEQMADIAHELGIWVDEDSSECQTAKKNADAITAEIEEILKYKDTELPLQGQIWKELTCLEKEEFRLRNVGSQNIENYKSDLEIQKTELRKKQNSCDMSNAMTCFITAISSPGIERCYFLKWMRMNLDNLSREKLSGLRDQYKKKCKSSENKEEIKEIDRQLSNSSLGTEHFFREMGQIYEASLSLPETHPSRKQFQHLPKLCAELLLDGFPLELVDGDASNIPLRWVSDVLSQLNGLVSPKNKILVVTVLGVQSTGKSTLLNTMFGVQFAVSSGRCTRGAFMLLIRISEDVQKILNCDFMVIIDTEGLKSPELAQLDNSHEHDNELATLVVGLSDITIINIAMENSTEMKDILQIVVHAFLRMTEVGKKPKCQFVHQNVSDVSAHEKNLRDRKLLLQQLNEMTQAAAKMEKKEENMSFSDVMEYSPDTGNWYIPGLWNGNPPMAPVNAGYSEAVYELKKNVIKALGRCESSANNILEFTEWMESLWNAVKHENFIFSFRNSLVADAYMRLCTEFNKWEWEFKKEMYAWVTKAETRISNFDKFAVESEKPDMKQFLDHLKSEACTVLTEWETKLLDNLSQYFKQTEGHVHLVEGYREDFANSAKTLRREMKSSVFNQLTATADIRQGMTELNKIKENHTKELEGRVCALIEECREKKVKMTDEELDKEFDKMWNRMVKELSFSKQKPADVFARVYHYLRENLSRKGSHVCQLLSNKSLTECGLVPFKYTAEGLVKQLKHKIAKWFNTEDHIKAVQQMADSIIADCKQFVTGKVERQSNYHDTYIQEILHMIDEKLQNNKEVKTEIEFEVSLKQHICGDAARQFQKMHEDFIHENDPYRCLNENKAKFRTDFKDVFKEQDQCQKKAEEFTNRCLKPAVEDFVKRSLGPDIIGEMMTSQQFSTRMFFQYSLLLDLLTKNDFESYLSCIGSYEKYVKKWILDQIVERFSKGSTVFELEDKHVQSSIRNITNAINKAKTKKIGKLKTFVKDVCQELSDKLVISQDALGAFMILNNADPEQFANWLTDCLKDMAEALRKKFKETNIQMKLRKLNVNPQNELFTRLIGCGKQCPFCKAPCEAGGKDHTEHWTSLHRPEGLGRCRRDRTKELVTDVCTSLVISDIHFRCSATNGEWHPYKDYKDIFPDWKIAPDVSLKASDYWKYVMTKFNKEFAERYEAKPADIPDTWINIEDKQAKESLKESFSIK